MSRYAETHKNSKGAGDARPTALQIVEDEGLSGKLSDKVFLVTGVSSGIGIETLRALYSTGGHVFGTVRDRTKGSKVVEDIKASAKGGEITLIDMEMGSLASVRKGAEEFLRLSKGKLNILISNAGVMATPEGRTKDGWEAQFGICHLGHFLLFQVVKDALLASSTPAFPSRVVAVSSIGHRSGEVRFDDYNFEKTPYSPWSAYGQAKTANIYFANEIERRYGSKGLHATSLHPGGIHTGLQVHVSDDLKDSWARDEEVLAYMKSPAQGAATSVYAALSEEWKGKGGKYLSDCVEQGPVKAGTGALAIGDDGFAVWAYDEVKEKRLWGDSLKFVELEDDM